MFFSNANCEVKNRYFYYFLSVDYLHSTKSFFLVPMIGAEALPVLEPLPVSIPASKDLIESRPARICGRKSLRC